MNYTLNGQLKPAYNVQIAAENYFVIHSYISSDRTDYNTLIQVLEKHKTAFGCYPEAAIVDSGYCSEKKLLLWMGELFPPLSVEGGISLKHAKYYKDPV